MSDSNIEWTDKTWNPVIGCKKVSPGCRNCYAIPQAARINRMQEEMPASSQRSYVPALTVKPEGRFVDWTGEVRFLDHKLDQPTRWRAPRRIFVNSMSDLFHEGVTEEQIARVFAEMVYNPRHTFQVLTKRSERMRDLTNDSDWQDSVYRLVDSRLRQTKRSRSNEEELENLGEWLYPALGQTFLAENIWLGVSIENSAQEHRVDDLRATPAQVRFLSAEPLLGSIWRVELGGMDWVIVGGESGPGARPMHPDWAREIRDNCEERGIPFFFKQWGNFRPMESDDDSSDGVPYSDLDTDIHREGYQWMTYQKSKRFEGYDLLDGKQWHQEPNEREETT